MSKEHKVKQDASFKSIQVLLQGACFSSKGNEKKDLPPVPLRVPWWAGDLTQGPEFDLWHARTHTHTQTKSAMVSSCPMGVRHMP